MKIDQIRDLNISGLAAEHDNFLSTCFHETPVSLRVSPGHTKILS